MTRKRMMRYAAHVYHDEPEDAATDSQMVDTFATKAEALRAAQRALAGYWNGGASIDRGEFEWVRGLRWELVEEYDLVCYVSPDGQPDPAEWALLP